MTASSPIPLDAFATELQSLDSDAFATLVGETHATTADAVDVDPPRVTVSEGGRRTEILAVAAADECEPDESVDAVAVASDSLRSGGAFDADVDTVAPAELRERLLYAASPAEANAIAERTLGVPVRSAEYDGVTDESLTAGEAADGVTDEPATADGVTDEPLTPGGTTTAEAAAERSTAAAERPTAAVEPSSERPQGAESETTDASSDRAYPRTLLAVVAVVALLGAGVAGAFVAAAVGPDGPGGVAGVEGGESTDPPPTGPDASGPADGNDGGGGTATADADAATSAETVDGEPTDGPIDEAARNTAPVPTCERSALQVVQTQMNALRYNDNATNDGVRTLRAFASPQNRAAVGPVNEFAALFETERYAPMLTYDTAEYSVPEVDGGTAEIDVVTRENGSVTGRYEFRLELISSGSQGTDNALGDVDGCWMTDAVASSTE